MRTFACCLAAVALMLLPIGCGEPGERAEPETEDQVLILAAASTQDALKEIAEALGERGGPELTVSPAGSNALAQQIIAGAPGDLLLSANPTWADEVAKHGHATETVSLLSGQLVLVVPSGNPANVREPDDLLGEGVRRVALAGEQVPAGMYADESLKNHGVYEALAKAGKIVRGQNVRLTLAYVERGEVEAGIVYASDAVVASNVQVVCTFAVGDHEPILYPLMLLEHGRDRPAARVVFEFLQSSEAGMIFEQYGFYLTNGTDEGAR